MTDFRQGSQLDLSNGDQGYLSDFTNRLSPFLHDIAQQLSHNVNLTNAVITCTSFIKLTIRLENIKFGSLVLE